jgi:hypothetical protein
MKLFSLPSGSRSATAVFLQATLCIAGALASPTFALAEPQPAWVLGDAGRSSAPLRPRGVPAKAVWVGGPDGGVFLLLQARRADSNSFHAQIWADRSGALLFKGLLVRTKDAPKAIELSDPAQFRGWDGVDLLLRGGGALRTASRRG